MQINFLKYKKIYFIILALICTASIASLVSFGVKPGIDFTGGSILEIEYKGERPENIVIEEKLAGLDLGQFTVQPAQEKGIIIRTKDITEEVHQQVIENLGRSEIEEKRFESVGSVIGKELKEKTITLVLVSLLAIILYIAFAFKKVQGPVNSWQYALSSLLCLFHDILIPLGVFALLGHLYKVEISIAVITALLTVIGCSINNVIVVFDRIRENTMRASGSTTFSEIVNGSINQTLGRCLSTSFAYLLPLVAIFLFGGETLKYFSLALILGIAAGTISGIFLAGPILANWVKVRK